MWTLASVCASSQLAQFEPMNPAPPKINTNRAGSNFLIVLTGPMVTQLTHRLLVFAPLPPLDLLLSVLVASAPVPVGRPRT
jgi:hypothetical protein